MAFEKSTLNLLHPKCSEATFARIVAITVVATVTTSISFAIDAAGREENMKQSNFEEEMFPQGKFEKDKGDNRFTVVSLFSGAGGLDMGFSMEDFNIVWANDLDSDACNTYRKNVGDHIQCGDIENYLPGLEKFKGKIDVLIGGPPCQGFSVAGKMNPDDPRSENVWRYLRALEIVRPKAFLMENVKALGVLEKWGAIREKLLEGMRKLGYNSNFIVVNASDFNVPQNRERVLFIGFLEDEEKPLDLARMLEPYKIAAPTVRETLLGLDRPGSGSNTNVCNARITFCTSPVMRKSPYAGMLFNGAGRPIRVNGYCSTLPASMGGNKTPFIDEEELYNGADSFVEAYHRGLADGSIKPEFKEAPKRLRRLTVEEAAAIQTFPKGYVFAGARSSMYKQIGNAVPCNLARQVAKAIKAHLAEMKGR